MSTLPRTRSLGGADSRNLTLNFKERKRPTSLCESSWHKVDPLGGGQDRLRRTPSQANNLCTTVPTSLVPRTLGGRHTPTRSSLRHSRMAVMSKNVREAQSRRWTNAGSIGRIAALVIAAQILVGVMGVVLALWLIQWASFLPFREVPHFAGALILSSGIIAVVLRGFLPRKQKLVSNSLKIFLAVILLATIISCASVCTFSILHLINLAPMECQMHSDVTIYPSSTLSVADAEELTTSSSETFSTFQDRPMKTTERLREDHSRYSDEGSGWASPSIDQFTDDEPDYDYPVNEELELNTKPFSPGEHSLNSGDVELHSRHCVCETRKKGWRIVKNYPGLSCSEVKNHLPILFVASCCITTVGGVLSSILLYLLWMSRRNHYRPYIKAKSSEVKPFIFKSNFKSTETANNNGNNFKKGSCLYR